MTLKAAPTLVLLLVFFACRSEPTRSGLDVDASPPVFRSVLDEHPRMVTVRLRDDLWAAYSAETGGLYRVWRDGVDLDGAVYTTVHGPQPTTLGPAYLVSADMQPWLLIRDDGAVEPTVQYGGHTYRDDQPSLHVRLHTESGETMTVTETPSPAADASGNTGLERIFVTENVPDGIDVAVRLTLRSLAGPDAYETDGTFEVTDSSEGALRGILTLNRNGETRFASFFGAPTVPAISRGGEATGPPGLTLIERSDCAACHNEEVQTVGPSYRAIAERYQPTDVNVVRLANKIIAGGSGVWGDAVMSPHPEMDLEDAKAMVEYILSLDGGETEDAGPLDVSDTTYALTAQSEGPHGLVVNIYPILGDALTLDGLEVSERPYYSGVVPALHATNDAQLGEVRTNVYVEATGYLYVEEAGNYVIRLVSDDGARMYLNGELLIDNDGLHGAEPRDSELMLEAGQHPIRIEFFQGGGGAALSLQWAGAGAEGFSVIPPRALRYERDDVLETAEYAELTGTVGRRPGDGVPLEDVHPSFSVETIRPDWFEPKVGGLDVLDDGRVVVSTWDPDGSVYILSNLAAGDRDDIEVKRVAWGLAEPLGLKVVDGDIYVMQKQELTRLVDTDGDDVVDVYETVANDWGATSNFHEFGFGLIYRDGYFYGTLATAILPGGASAQPQNPDRGSVIKIDSESGDVEIIARGLRTPNGIAFGYNDEIFVADNQGDWLPASKIVHIVEGEFYGSRSVDPEGTAGLDWKRPVVWLQQDEIGNSPSQPALLNVGPYRNQMIHGEVTHGGIKRVFVEEVAGQLQGAVFRFTHGLEAGVNRIVWGPDGKLYIGGVGNPGNRGHVGKLMHGLQRMTYTGDPVFEMLAVRAQSDGFEIEFTEPLAEGAGLQPEDYTVQQWRYEPTADYGGPKIDLRQLPVEDVEVSEDRRRVRLTIPGMQPDHIVYFRLNDDTMSSASGRRLWTTEAWYTLNRIPGR